MRTCSLPDQGPTHCHPRLRHAALLCAPLLLLLTAVPTSALREAPPRPNFLIIMADDLGIGDLGCYGNATIRTPHIDRLAEDGVRLMHHLAAESMCTPSRAAFLTGRYPIRSGMTSAYGQRVLQWAAAAGGLPPEEITFGRILQGCGYITGLVGKWHLGLSCTRLDDLCHHPLHHGFHHFLGLPLGMMADCAGAGPESGVGPSAWAAPSEKRALLECRLRLLGRGLAAVGLAILFGGRGLGWGPRARWGAGLASMGLAAILEAGWRAAGAAVARADCFLMRNASVTQQPLQLGHVNPLLLREVEDFLWRHGHAPFLLFVSLLHAHTPLVTSPPFRGRSAHGRYGDNVEEMDWVVGRILAALDRVGAADRTLVHFTSDNGGWLEAHAGGERLGGWNGVYRGGKGMGGWEGGIRVPAIFRFPGVFPRGRVVDEPTSAMDVFPTVVKMAGGALPGDRAIDGHDLAPLLRGDTTRSAHDVLLHYCEVFLHAARWADRKRGKVWKAHFVTPTFSPPGSGSCAGEDDGGSGSHDGEVTFARICACAHDVTEHDPPLLFELTSDPGEARPLTPGVEPAFSSVVARLRQEHARQRRSLSQTRQQLGSLYTTWRPWLQPCCGRLCACDLEGRDGSGNEEEESWGREIL